ncbi:MAG: tetratricopeptide repeat protein [Betaproteobacteria bacterium]|nr:tetratricopeptide repeat protein [Betaproteobacteria bacterium]
MLRQLLRSLARRSPDAAALNEEGIRLWQAGELKGAEQRFRDALARDDSHAAACSNLGMVLVEQRRLEEGLDRLQHAVAIDPKHAGARINLANTLHFDGQVDAAVAHYLEALRLAPDAPETRVNVVKPLMDACQWREVELITAELEELHRTKPETAWAERVMPFVSQLLPLAPEFRKRLAAHYAGRLAAAWAHERERIAGLRGRRARDHDRIRIGYASGDFRNHALAHLTAGMFELHDRSRFEVCAYSWAHDDGSEFRRRIVGGVERFADIEGERFEASAERIARDGIDILIDLTGYAGGSRSEIFAMRPAPVQVNWLGYPGTTGADFIDYFIADRVALPESIAWQFSEAIAWLPNCYQVNDATQRIAEAAPSRSEAGLPNEAFVFCCFNQAYKIERTMFEAWMRVLQAVPGSVLWLMRSSQLAQGNLCRAAEGAGVDSRRLVFAKALPKEEHLARHRLADLFLDTRIINAGTTASDALWAGLPVLTCPGETLGTRVAASLVSALGLEDLVVRDLTEYERLAIDLARNPAKLAEIRTRLASNRLTTPLFDTRRFVADFERALEIMHARAISGEPPRSFVL